VIFLKADLTTAPHRIRSLISVAGIAFRRSRLMLTVVTILQGAIGMFSGILSSDSEIIVFERTVSTFSSATFPRAVDEIDPAMVSHATPVLFGIVSSADHPIITCFGVTVPTPASARLLA